MQQCAACRQGVMLAQKPLHPDGNDDKANLGHGGASQCAFQIDGEYRQNRAKHHCDNAQNQNKLPPSRIMQEKLAADDNRTKYACFCQQTAEQRTGGCRCNGIRIRQPDMQRKQPCLRRKAKQNQYADGIELRRVFPALHKRGQLCHVQRACLLIHHKQTHQCHQTANHRYRKVGFCGANRKVLLIMHNQHKRGKGHNFKENKCRKQIGGKENSHRCAQCQEHKEIIPISVPFSRHVFLGKDGCNQPDCARQHGKNHAEAIRRKAQTQAAEAAQAINRFLPNQRQARNENHRG